MFHSWMFLILVAVEVHGISNPTKCSNGSPLPNGIRIDGCYPCAPCKFEVSPKITLEIDFTAPETLLSSQAQAVFNVCGLLDLLLYPTCQQVAINGCPLNAGANTTYTVELAFNDYWEYVDNPSLEISIEDDSANSIVCFKFPITFV